MANELQARPDQIDTITAVFADETVLRLPPRKIQRWNESGLSRKYFEIDEPTQTISWYHSLTTALGRVTPTPEHLKKWIAETGYDAAIEYRDERAHVGTILHILIAQFLQARTITRNAVHAEIERYREQYQLGDGMYNFDGWASELFRDLLSFAVFVRETRLEPVAIEIMCAGTEGFWPVATAIDLVAYMWLPMDSATEISAAIEEWQPTAAWHPLANQVLSMGFGDGRQYEIQFGEFYKSGPRKGEPRILSAHRRVLALGDYKSSLKGFPDSLAKQVKIGQMLFEQNFPDLKIEHLFGWRPSDWRTRPTYHLVDVTGKVDDFLANAALAHACADLGSPRPPAKQQYPEEISLDGELPEILTLEPEQIILGSRAPQPDSAAEQTTEDAA